MNRMMTALCATILTLAACQGSDNTANQKDDGQITIALTDGNGNPFPCQDDPDCLVTKVPKDQHFNGASCSIDKTCDANVRDSICSSDPMNKDKTVCELGPMCGNDEECDDGNPCTEDLCNKFILGGRCTHGLNVETCDGLDNDCDGQIDEGFGETTCGLGQCLHTVQNCSSGQTQTCDPLAGAKAEICDGKDNDCDGLTDEELPDLTCGVGACFKLVLNCVDGVLQTCVPGTPSAETCNGLDDDCDGLVDNGLGTTSCGIGECKNTVDNCRDNVPQTCVPGKPLPFETCNGLDDDCDGEIDEDLGFSICGVGACFRLVPNCVDGVPQTCVPGIPSLEVCNGLDDDCDTFTDEDLGTTTCGLGQCLHTAFNCVDGKVQVCDPFAGQTSEVCDNKDNDCDGKTDEDLGTTTCGKGICVHTVQNCVGGQVMDCDPFKGAVPEICNGLDDDCDGVVDENLGQTTCGVGECKHTVDNCKDSAAQTCVPGVPSPEVCNGLDDDCDGVVDENLGQTTCGKGICVHTVQNCVGGQTQTCDPLAGAKTETCDGLDNDCDGAVDEEEVCNSCALTLDNIVCKGNIDQVYYGAPGQQSWINHYQCLKDPKTGVLYSEPGYEAVFKMMSLIGGAKVTAKFMNVTPVDPAPDLDLFILQGTCGENMPCASYGLIKQATVTTKPDSVYYFVVDEGSGTAPSFMSFELHVTCTEVACHDGLDNDGDGLTDCADPDCTLACN